MRLTIVLYVILICIVKKKTTPAAETSRKIRSVVMMTHGIVAGLIACNVPFMLMMVYFATKVAQGRIDIVFQSNFGVTFIY